MHSKAKIAPPHHFPNQASVHTPHHTFKTRSRGPLKMLKNSIRRGSKYSSGVTQK